MQRKSTVCEATPNPPLRRKRQVSSDTSSSNTPLSLSVKRTKAAISSPDSEISTPKQTLSFEEDRETDNTNHNSGLSTEKDEMKESESGPSGLHSEKLESQTLTPVTLESIMDKLCMTCNTVNEMKVVMEEMRGSMFELRQENDKLKKEIDLCRNREEVLKEEVKEAQYAASLALEQVNKVEQYTRRNNLRIFGVPEPRNRGGGESQEDENESDWESVKNLMVNKLKVKVTTNDIEAVHRVGKRSATTPRGIIVRFVNRRKRDEVVKARRVLKGTGTVVTDDLTQQNYRTLAVVKDDELCAEAWSARGQIFMKTVSGRVVKVETKAQLQDPEKRRFWATKPRQRDQASARPASQSRL